MRPQCRDGEACSHARALACRVIIQIAMLMTMPGTCMQYCVGMKLA
jgi:hypothetical protein